VSADSSSPVERGPRRRWYLHVAIALVLGAIAGYVWHVTTAEDWATRRCGGIKVGMSDQELKAHLKDRDLAAVANGPDTLHVSDGDIGAVNCTVRVVGWRVSSISFVMVVPQE
jgi:hypothetical protein